MARKKTNALPSLEILIIIVFFLSFALWAVPKCSSTKQEFQEEAMEDELEQLIIDSLKKAEEAELLKQKEEAKPKPPVVPSTKDRVTLLYITIDGMNVRSAPNTKSQIVDRLKLFDGVVFLTKY